MYYQSFYIVRCVCNFCMGMWAHYMAVSDFTQGPLGPGSLWEPSAWDPRQNTSSKLVSQPLGSLIRATNLLAYHSMETGLKTLLLHFSMDFNIKLWILSCWEDYKSKNNVIWNIWNFGNILLNNALFMFIYGLFIQILTIFDPIQHCICLFPFWF